ncbi:MAG: 16S rRNA (guanine(966)-N(2))-methyltransferase RsmD [Coriobacteriales bacterium]
MRIVAGEFKGRVIKSPSEETTRPTTDRVRESVFSSVCARMPQLSLAGVSVLDAFAGSGALGFEALSRGAQRCSFWESDAAARKVLEANAASLGLDRRRYSCKGADVLQASQRPLAFGQGFGLVLLDPPYALEPAQMAAFLARLREHGDLAPGAIAVYEHALAKQALVQEELGQLEGFELTGLKKYGKVGVAYLELKEEQDA